MRQVVDNIGYNHCDVGFDANTCAVITAIGKQSGDIAMGVDESENHEQEPVTRG